VRRSVVTGAALAALLVPAGAVAATTTPPDSSPPETVGTVPTETVEVIPVSEAPPSTDEAESDAGAPAGEPATVYDDSGNPVAAITVSGAESAWGEYEEGNEPEAGREYFRVTVSVESLITDGTFGVNIDQFVLQDNNGFLTTAENVPTATQAEADEDITEEADLGNGESVELTLTFEVVSSVGPQSLFYRPDDDRLVDVAEFA